MVLYLTRKSPPSKGGMETLSYQFSTSLSEAVPVHVVANRRGRRWLLGFMVTALLRSMRVLRKKVIRVVHLGDPVLVPIGLMLRTIYSVPVVVTVHGLDIVYSRWLYQKVIPRLLKRVDGIVAISQAAKRECLARGIPEGKLRVIPAGLRLPADSKGTGAAGLPAEWGLEDARRDGRSVLLTVGRLIPRKGVARFVGNILPTIAARHPGVIYVVVGDGPERQRIATLAEIGHVTENVKLLGEIEDAHLEALYRLADIFVMPNVPVAGDLEGFGIVALEASARGLAVVASRLEGIMDAVADGENGILVDPGDDAAFRAAILRLIDNADERKRMGSRARTYTTERFAWPRIIRQYLEMYDAVLAAFAGR